MTKEYLFDFLLFHAYSKLGGFLVNVLGLAVAVMGILMYVTGKTGATGAVLYIGAALAFLSYTPVLLKARAAKQVRVNPEFCQPIEYTFSEEGILAKQSDGEKAYSWEEIQRGVVTPKTIGLYYEEEKALIIPKADFGEQFGEIFQMIAVHLGRMKLR